MGSFRLTAGTWHLHHDYNFTGSVVETVHQSFRLSCRSELTRQGTSLTKYLTLSCQRGLYLYPTKHFRISFKTGRRVVFMVRAKSTISTKPCRSRCHPLLMKPTIF